jgi:hypothetical protein
VDRRPGVQRPHRHSLASLADLGRRLDVHGLRPAPVPQLPALLGLQPVLRLRGHREHPLAGDVGGTVPRGRAAWGGSSPSRMP